MSVTGISGNSLFELVQAEKNQTQSTQSNTIQNIGQEFGQLGQDLQAGNLTQAQQDFTTLSSDLSSLQGSSSTPTSGSSSSNTASSIQQAFNSLQQDLQAGNLTQAQQDFGNLQQSLQSAGRDNSPTGIIITMVGEARSRPVPSSRISLRWECAAIG